MDQTGPAYRYLTEKYPGISDAKIKQRVLFSSVHRSTGSSEISSSTKFSGVTRRGHGMVDGFWQPTFWEITRLTILVN